MQKEVKKFTQLRRLSAIGHDIVATVIAWWLAFALRFNFQIPPEFYDSIMFNGLWVLPMEIAMFFQFGLYRGVWRFASLPDLKRIINALFVASLVIMVIKIMLGTAGIIPRSVHILNPILLLMMMGGSRFVYRAWKDHSLYSMTSSMGKPVVVIGAGDLAINLLNDLTRSQDWRVVGVVDEESHLHGREIRGVRVLGSISELDAIVKDTEIEHVILALTPKQHQTRKKAIAAANQLGLNVLTVPSLDDLIAGKLSVSEIRKVDVEDLLGRDPVSLDVAGLETLIKGKHVLVTGAAGSIGSELTRQLLKFKPSLLVCIDISEYSLYLLEQELSRHHPDASILYMVADVKNKNRIDAILSRYEPSIVFHAAAYKHVPMMENGNVSEALSNNVLGTYQLAKQCKEHGVKKMVLVSTDKAVNPTNVMGASKRLAEMICQGLQETTGTRFVIVRFGNVLGSSGSVIPKFREQIAAGGPVTVTHPEITRYFMSIPEAAQLVMQAGMMGEGGEIFVLDMGESVKIVDLAKDMIRLSGFTQDQIAIEFTGLRPGEKLYEELLADGEHTLPTPHEKLRIASARQVDEAWVNALLEWIKATMYLDEALIKKELSLWAEEYVGDVNNNKSEQSAVIAPQSSTIH